MKNLCQVAALLTALFYLTIESNGQAVHRMSNVATSAQPVQLRPQPCRWYVRTTANFRVFAASEIQAKQVAVAAEQLRTDLVAKWLGEDIDNPWQPSCDIVVHPSPQSYSCAVGRGPAQTSGCSTVVVDKGRILARRIDLRCDNRDPLTAALPHELTHVVLADRYLDPPLPRWADEGIALLADPAAKLAGHERDLQAAVNGGTRIRLASLVQMNDYPANQVAAFYAQSASLVRFLVCRHTEKTFLDFIDCALKQGYDVALQEMYGIHSVDELERAWMHDLLHSAVNGNEPPHWPTWNNATRGALVSYRPAAKE